MFGLGMPEFLVITLIFLIIFGAGKLPEVGAGMGKAIKNFRNATSENEHEIKSAEDTGDVNHAR